MKQLFNWRAALVRWLEVTDPDRRHSGLVAIFCLPLEFCQTTNMTRNKNPMAAKRTKDGCFALMQLQWRIGGQCVYSRALPLNGRPFVNCVRFSSVPPDEYGDYAKIPVDILCAPNGREQRRRLGIIRDDGRRSIETVQSWRYAPPGDGFVIIEVWEKR